MTLTLFIYILAVASAAITCVLAENSSIKLLQKYIQIRTADPNPDYEIAILWIKEQSDKIGLEFHRLNLGTPDVNSTQFAVWLTWPGENLSIQSILLNSHIDVVSADLEGWSVDPFEGIVSDDGYIYGRGVQDMKSIAVQYLEAIRRLKEKGIVPTRTIHLLFLPSEESDGSGMKLFTRTSEFEDMTVGFALDEGMPNDGDKLNVFYAERKSLWLKVTVTGPSGHGSLLLENTAGEKLQKVVTALLRMRESEKLRLNLDKSLKLGDVTTINLNVIHGGLQPNVIPARLSATFDIRVTPRWDLKEFMRVLNRTCEEAGPGVSMTYLSKEPDDNKTDHSMMHTHPSEDTWWWKNFKEAFKILNITIVPSIFPAATDGRTLRKIGIPVLGMSPIFESANTMHGNDERLSINDFLKGIDIYEALIEKLSVIPAIPDHPTQTTEQTILSTDESTRQQTSNNFVSSTKPSSRQQTKSAGANHPIISTIVTLICLPIVFWPVCL